MGLQPTIKARRTREAQWSNDLHAFHGDIGATADHNSLFTSVSNSANYYNATSLG